MFLTSFFIKFLMEEDFLHGIIKFKKKPGKQGKDYCFWIPRTYITNGLIKPGTTYEIFLKEVSDKPEKEENKEEN